MTFIDMFGRCARRNDIMINCVVARRFIDVSMKNVLQRTEAGVDSLDGKPDVCSSLMALQRYDLDEVAALTADLFSGAAHTVRFIVLPIVFIINLT